MQIKQHSFHPTSFGHTCRGCGLDYTPKAWDKRSELEGWCYSALQTEDTHVFELIGNLVACKYCGADEGAHNLKCEG